MATPTPMRPRIKTPNHRGLGLRFFFERVGTYGRRRCFCRPRDSGIVRLGYRGHRDQSCLGAGFHRTPRERQRVLLALGPERKSFQWSDAG
jgi:hypothetical protein